MHIGIIGTRGIPNNYGGFEQFAEYLSIGLINAGFQVTVYNSHNHPFKGNNWKGVNIIHRYDPENRIGTVGQFVYDLNCIRDSGKRSFDVILQLGYSSSSVWSKLLLMGKSIVTTNMDGLEWKRTKYSNKVRKFLLYAEQLAVRSSHHLIADSTGIQTYLKDKYGVAATYIPYGANLFVNPVTALILKYKVKPFEYNMLVSRLEKENSIETILDGVCRASSERTFLVVGNHQTNYGSYLKEKYKGCAHIVFLGGIFNIESLNNLRYYCNSYFHGHTVGGTNPSLLEAMASNALICAHDNVFNRSVLNADGFYFSNAADVANLLMDVDKNSFENMRKVKCNVDKISSIYSWQTVIDKYIEHFESIVPRLAVTI